MELEQGLFHIPADIYHAMPGLSYTGVKDMMRSPAHYRAVMDGEKEESPAMRFGSAYHTYNLEHDLFHSEYAVKPDDLNLRSAEGQQWAAENTSKKIITQKDHETIRAMADVLWAHKEWQRLAPGSDREVAMIWWDEEYQVWCRTRIDLLAPAFSLPVDLKTTTDARKYPFLASAWTFGYHIQAAWTLRGLRIVTQNEHENFAFFAQEKTPPYAVGIYQASPAFLYRGNADIRAVLPTYAECLRTNTWPAYGEEIKPLDLPTWVEQAE